MRSSILIIVRFSFRPLPMRRRSRALWPDLRAAGKPVDVQITATETGLDIDLRGLGAIGEAMRLALLRRAQALDLARLTVHGETIVETRPPLLTIGKARLKPPPGGFLQATKAGEQALAEAVIAALPARARRIADLFCGVGPFALRIAERSAILAIDSESRAIEALRAAAHGAQGLKPVEVQRRDLVRNPLSALELTNLDAVVFDPPRSGAAAQAERVAKSRVPVVIAVSCNPASFAADAWALLAGGYRLDWVRPIDQFVWSAHVELVARFSRG
jgi:23S rRNA (uracil1939-C5)-methyltransferase